MQFSIGTLPYGIKMVTEVLVALRRIKVLLPSIDVEFDGRESVNWILLQSGGIEGKEALGQLLDEEKRGEKVCLEMVRADRSATTQTRNQGSVWCPGPIIHQPGFSDLATRPHDS